MGSITWLHFEKPVMLCVLGTVLPIYSHTWCIQQVSWQFVSDSYFFCPSTRCRARRYRLSFLIASWCIYILIILVEMHGCSKLVVFSVFLFVLVVNTSCSIAVLKTLSRPAPGDGEMTEKDGKIKTYRGKRENNSLKRRAFNTIIIIQTVLFLNYLPTVLCFPLIGLLSPFTFKCQCLSVALAASVSCGYLQPLLRLHKLGWLPFRKTNNTWGPEKLQKITPTTIYWYLKIM